MEGAGEERSQGVGLDHHLPLEYDVLAVGLAERFSGRDRAMFERLARLLVAHWAVEVQQCLMELRRAYRPFDPSRDTLPVPGEAADGPARERFLGGLKALMERANYHELPREALERALGEASPEGVSVSVELEEFACLRAFARGSFRRKLTVGPRFRRRVVETPGFRRVLLAVGLHEAGSTLHLRLYKDVCATDLEMFLPNTKVRMRAADKLLLALTGGGGTIGGIVASATKLGATTTPVGLAAAIGGFAGVVWRQVKNVFHKRTSYMARHTQALYFHTLDNDLGALVHVAQMAAQEEAKEALLAYALLASAPEEALDAVTLDRRAEQHLLERHGARADFEVEAGLAKLAALGLLAGDESGVLAVPPPSEALVCVDRLWDARFGEPIDSRGTSPGSR